MAARDGAASRGRILVDLEEVGKVVMIPRRHIAPDPGQPRKYFNQDKIHRLARSMRKRGQVTPIWVVATEDEEFPYRVVDGGRRLKAAEIAELPKMKAIVVPFGTTRREIRRLQMVANAAREDLAPLEKAHAYAADVADGMSVAEIAEEDGCTDASVRQYLALEKLDPEVKRYLDPSLEDERQMPLLTAVAISRLADKATQRRVANAWARKGMSLLEVRTMVASLDPDAAGKPAGRPYSKPSHIVYHLLGLSRSLPSQLRQTLKAMEERGYLDMSQGSFNDAFKQQSVAEIEEVVSGLLASSDLVQQIFHPMVHVLETRKPGSAVLAEVRRRAQRGKKGS